VTDYVDLSLALGLQMSGESEENKLQRQLSARISSIATEHDTKSGWFDRFDALYFTQEFTEWGADLWADDPSATTEGRSHVSINTPHVYVNIPAALEAHTPIENMLAAKDSPESRSAAQAMERVRKAWKTEERWQLKRHKAAVVKRLYGETAGYVYYDREKGRPCATVIQNPRNLWIGYKNDDYEEVEWAAHVSLVDPNSLIEDYSVDVTVMSLGEGKSVPWVVGPTAVIADEPRPMLTYGPARIEVWDYWYRQPAEKRGERGEPTKMETYNVVIAGNEIVRGPYKYEEYDGAIPYQPLYNSFTPGAPIGRSDLHDMEQLIREKMTRITAGAQMINSATAGFYWQLTGPDAPSRVPAGAKPKMNDVATPGAGNRIEAITPFVAQFQLEQYLGRIDRESIVVSGLNDLLLGLVPAQGLSSSKAINALISNYETRLELARTMFYQWDVDMWNLVVKVWTKFDKTIRKVVEAGGGILDIVDPSLSPRDEFETAQRAANLVGAKLWSQARAMDAVGVDDPEQEQNIIREESTDATLWPDRVTVMAQLLATLQSLQQPIPGGAQEQAQGQLASGTEGLQTALGEETAGATEGSQYGTPEQTPVVAGGENSPFAQGPQGLAGNEASAPLLQGMITGGTQKTRVMTQTKLGRGA
jgi:hypothetical protein